jgi:hypothetical protein
MTPTFGQPRARAEQQHLAEQPGQRRLVALDEPRDRRVIRTLLRGDDAEGDVLDARALDDPRGTNPARVGVEQQRDHHRRLVGRAALAVDPMSRIERVEIHLLDRRQHEPRQVVLRQPVTEIRRHQKRLITVARNEAQAHARHRLNRPGQHRLTRQPRSLR